jgi:two-component system LytT family sensor kinase
MKQQYWYSIFFSDDRSFRWKRHFLFWLAVAIYQCLRIGIMMPIKNWNSFLSILELVFFWGIIMNMLLSYTVVYFIFPRYFKRKKYIQFVTAVLLTFIAIQVIGFIHTIIITGGPAHDAIGYTRVMDFLSLARPAFIRLFGNPPLICCLLLALKTLKNWHLEQLKTETLAKENANAELQLLKAQIHPHFLFNTLNNIYSFSLYRSPEAGALVKKLSGMLGYMVNECNEKLVPLKKELRLIQDYMGLEKIRYGKRLAMDIEIHGEFENKMIAPLLMIPFIENSFKHGTSQMLRHPWIKLEITTVNNQLFLRLSNSKPSIASSNGQNKGIGLLNVKKRLELLYPGKHQLDISVTEETFTVNMQLLLEEHHFANSYADVAAKTIAYA